MTVGVDWGDSGSVGVWEAGGRSTVCDIWLYSPISCHLQPVECKCVNAMVLGWSELVCVVDWDIQ